MSNLTSSFNAVYPILLYIIIGMIVRKASLVSDSGIKEMNGLVYKVFFPSMMYVNLLDSNLAESINVHFIVFTLSLITLSFVFLMILIPVFVKKDSQKGVMVQGIFRSNFIVFGMSIIISLYGTEKIGPATILAAFTIPYMNALSVVALEVFRGGKPNIWKIMIKVLKNPIIIGTLLGLLMKILGFDPFHTVIRNVAKISTPFALIVIGASFKLSNLQKYGKILSWGILGKLFLLPLCTLSVCIVFGYRDELLITQMAIFAGPCATASYAMAQQMDGDGDLAALLVMTTSTLCVFSFFIWILILKSLHFA